MFTPTKVSADEFEAFIKLPENQDYNFELIDGEIFQKMATHLRGIIINRILAYIFFYLEDFPIGYSAAEPRFKPTPQSEHDLIPDGAFTVKSRGIVRKGAMAGVPDLAIEVQSPDQTEEFMRKKAQIYLEHGTALVWLVFPEQRIVEVLTQQGSHTLNENDVLDGGNVLPNFQLAVSKIFAGL
jgi:Uma2 family endonuclease